MSKITIENKKGKIIIINKLSYPETVNERVYNSIAYGTFEGFLPMTVKKKGKDTSIECVVQGLIPFTQYFANIVTKKMFLDLVGDVANLIKKCEINMISPNNLDLSKDKMFVDPVTKRLRCIYWPVVNNQWENPPDLFLRQIPFELSFNKYSDNEYLNTYIAFFGGTAPFSINSFDKLLMKLSGKEIVSGYNAPSESLTGPLSKENKSKKKELNKSNIEYDPFAETESHDEAEKAKEEKNNPTPEPIPEPTHASSETTTDNEHIFCSSCGVRLQKGVLFCSQCGTAVGNKAEIKEEKSYKDVEHHTEYMADTCVIDDDDDGTRLLGYEPEEEREVPVLTRLKTKEAFKIDGNVMIGSDPQKSDLVIAGNTYISRKHAYISEKDGRYYITDCGSTNKTFVDGVRVMPNTTQEIKDGTQIRLANETFAFNFR